MINDGYNFDTLNIAFLTKLDIVSFLFTGFRLDNLGDIIRDIGFTKPESKYDFYIKNDGGLNNDLNLLSNAVVMKNTVGYMTWTLFSSITATIISMKYLVRQM